MPYLLLAGDLEGLLAVGDLVFLLEDLLAACDLSLPVVLALGVLGINKPLASELAGVPHDHPRPRLTRPCPRLRR